MAPEQFDAVLLPAGSCPDLEAANQISGGAGSRPIASSAGGGGRPIASLPTAPPPYNELTDFSDEPPPYSEIDIRNKI
jgi:hypothetical protein